MMARSDMLLHSEAGYIDARPLKPDRRNFLQRTAGPYIGVTCTHHVAMAATVGLASASDSRGTEEIDVRTSSDLAGVGSNVVLRPRAKSATSQTLIIRQHAFFGSAIRKIAASTLLHRNRIGSNLG
jgi:hypothetical protein